MEILLLLGGAVTLLVLSKSRGTPARSQTVVATPPPLFTRTSVEPITTPPASAGYQRGPVQGPSPMPATVPTTGPAYPGWFSTLVFASSPQAAAGQLSDPRQKVLSVKLLGTAESYCASTGIDCEPQWTGTNAYSLTVQGPMLGGSPGSYGSPGTY